MSKQSEVNAYLKNLPREAEIKDQVLNTSVGPAKIKASKIAKAVLENNKAALTGMKFMMKVFPKEIKVLEKRIKELENGKY